MKTSITYPINGKIDFFDTTQEIIDAVDIIKHYLTEDIIPTIDKITIKSSSAGKNCLVIFHLKRDQRVRFKKLASQIIEETKLIGSIYVEFKDTFILAGGLELLFEKTNGFNFHISPYSPFKNNNDEKFYKEIQFFAPKGRTRNAIIIGLHCGLIPIHVADQYNRVYAIEDNDKVINETKQNLIANKINNCLVYSKKVNTWVKEFIDGAYNPPGKTQRIGLMIVNIDMIDKKTFEMFSAIKAETVVMYSESEERFKEYSKLMKTINYKTREIKHISSYYLDKFKRLEDDTKNQ